MDVFTVIGSRIGMMLSSRDPKIIQIEWNTWTEHLGRLCILIESEKLVFDGIFE